MTPVAERLSDERLATLISGTTESVRLLNIRYERSAIPEDATEYADLLHQKQLLLSLATELQHRRAARDSWSQKAAIEQALERLWDRQVAGEQPSYPETLEAISSAMAASPSSPATGVRVTFADLKRDAEDALDALTAYAHNNEALEDACGESAKAMVAATWNRVKAEQALTAVRDMTFKSAPARSALGEQS